MIEETLHAANWWVEKIKSYNINVEAPSWLSHFEKVMTELLRAKYHNHWYNDNPSRGSGYRAISNEYSLDPILDKAAKAVSHSLPKNLARMVLTSDDRWLVMFVNPGEVIVRDKKFKEKCIYDKSAHIYDKLIMNKIHRNKKNTRYISKSDDETPNNNSNNKGDIQDETKSDPEDSNNNNNNTKDIDYRQLFLQNIHNAARRNKEKEIEAHVQAFKEEMRINHYNMKYKFGPYDEHDVNYNSNNNNEESKNNSNQTSSPSKLSTTSTSNSGSTSVSVMSDSNDVSASNVNINSSPKDCNNQNENEFEHIKLQNGFISNHSNLGRDLVSILNSCKIHPRNGISNSNAHSNIHSMNNDYIIEMDGEYPILFPLCYASPSPSPSPQSPINTNITPPLVGNIIENFDKKNNINQSDDDDQILIQYRNNKLSNPNNQ